MTETETATDITAKKSASVGNENSAKETAGIGKESVTGNRHRLLRHRRPGTDITAHRLPVGAHHRLLLRLRADEKFSTEINSLRYGEGIFCRKNFFLTE